MAVTAVDQFELGSTPALLMGASTVYRVTMVDGLGLPAVAANDLPLAEGGVYAARDSLDARTVSIDLVIVDTSTFMTSVANFLTAWQSTNTDVALTYRLHGQGANRYVMGRPRRATFQLRPESGVHGYVTAQVDFYCQDPQIYLSGSGTPTII